MRKNRLIKQILVAIGILAAGLVLLAALRLPIAVVSFLLTRNPYVLDVLWGSVILGVFLSGIGKPGIVAAPFVFGALWLCAASIDHWQVRQSIDPKVWSAPISAEAVQGTLIVYGSGSIDRKILFDGHVDRLVRVAFENTTRKIEAIEELSIASGEACSNKQSSRPMQESGQPDKCFWWRGLTDVPDGLVIEQTHRAITYNQPGCCNETQARLRVGGKERLLFSWFQGVAYVLPYFPRPSLLPTPKGFFDLGGGLSWPFVYGIENIAPGAMASAIYGAKLLYGEDNGPRPALPLKSGKEPLDQAEALANLENVSQRIVVKELIAAQQKGIVDERSIAIAASLVGHGSDSWAAVSEYATTLTNEQMQALFEAILRRLETPNSCGDCAISTDRSFGLSVKNLRDRLGRPDDFADRARRLFGKGSDVAGWQYEGSLSIMLALGPQDHQASRNFKDLVIVPMLLADDTPAYSDKVTACIRLGVTQLSTDQAVARLNLVRDEHLKDYIFAFWNWNLSQLRFYRADDAPKQFVQASKICERISKISDGELRRQDFRVDCRAAAASLQ